MAGMIRVLGIDPGLQRTGYGCVELRPGRIEPTLIEAGVFNLSPKLALHRRLHLLHQDLTELIRELSPTEMAVEKLFSHYKHPRTAILMGHARGTILLAAAQHGLALTPLAATEVKRAVSGYGHASKQQMQLAVQSQCQLPEPPSPPDVADAIAIALCRARRVALDHLGAGPTV